MKSLSQRSQRQLASAWALVFASSDAMARGGDGGMIVLLVLLFAPLIVYLLRAYIALCFTLVPIAMGGYFLFTANSIVPAIIGGLMMVGGGAMTYAMAPRELQEKARKIIE